MGEGRQIVTRAIGRMARRLAGRAEPLILLYHRVAHVPIDPWSLAVGPDVFARQMEFFVAERTIVPLEWLAGELRAGRYPRRAMAITFDDGYRDVLDHAKPVLDTLDIPATVFLVSGAFGAVSGFWWDRLAAAVFGAADIAGATHLPFLTRDQRDAAVCAVNTGDTDLLYMTAWAAIRFLPAEEREAAVRHTSAALGGATAGHAPVMSHEDVRALLSDGRITIGAHTVSHPSLPSLTVEEQLHEMAQCRSALEALTGGPVRGFAYPFGDHDGMSARAAQKAGFAYAVTSLAQTAAPGGDPWRLPRFDVKSWTIDQCRQFLDASITVLGHRRWTGLA